ncbi:MBL fold metallo-hydrolase [Bacillus tianshenii]|nr:MBL fold metallo-hydrolase [Bacillus tianshenii]
MVQTLQRTQDIYQLTLPTPFSVGPVNVYLIKGDKLTLIDVGPNTAEAREALISQLDELGYDLLDIEQVVLTHHHPDHVGQLHLFSAHAEVIGHWRNQPWLTRDEKFATHNVEFFRRFLPQQGVTENVDKWIHLFFNGKYSCKSSLTQEIKEGDVLPALDEWKVFETPGHAQSHLVFYREKDGVLLGGDHIIGHISSNPLMEPPYLGETERPRAAIQYRDSLKKCLELEISTVLSGHGKEVRKVRPLLERRFERRRGRAEKVLEMLKGTPMSAFEISKVLFPAVYERELFLTMSETTGQLDQLEEAGGIIIDKSESVWKYEAK